MWHRFAAWWRGWRYHWSPGTRLEPVRVGEGDPRFGSMSAADDWAWEREQRTHATIMRDLAEGPPGDGTFAFTVALPVEGGSSCSFLPAEPPRLPDADTREQMLAELSPEALERLRGPEQPQEVRAPAGARCSPGNENGDRDAGFPQGPQAAVPWGDDPGLGAGSSSAPGPAPALNVALPGPGVGDGIEWAVNAAIGPHIERLADTGEIASARQLAEWDADLRAQDDDAARYLAGLGFECERYRLEMAEAWA